MANYTEAFAAYCRGTPAEEICSAFGLTMPALLKRMEIENWAGLRTVMVSVPVVNRPDLSPLANARMNLIEEHRAANYRNARLMQEHLTSVLSKLAAGDLKVKKTQLHGKSGCWSETETDPSTGDLVNLATYAKLVAELGYRALGDLAGGEKGSPDANAGPGSVAPAVTIILPGAIGAPRDQRGQTVIDLRPEDVKTERVITEDKPE